MTIERRKEKAKRRLENRQPLGGYAEASLEQARKNPTYSLQRWFDDLIGILSASGEFEIPDPCATRKLTEEGIFRFKIEKADGLGNITRLKKDIELLLEAKELQFRRSQKQEITEATALLLLKLGELRAQLEIELDIAIRSALSLKQNKLDEVNKEKRTNYESRKELFCEYYRMFLKSGCSESDAEKRALQALNKHGNGISSKTANRYKNQIKQSERSLTDV